MKKRALIFLTLSLFSTFLFSQKTFRIAGKPLVGFKASSPKYQRTTVHEGKTLYAKVFLENYAEIEEHFVYELICEDPNVTVVPNQEHPGWFNIQATGEKRGLILKFYCFSKENIFVKHALPKIREKEIMDENGNWVYGNIIWSDIDYQPGERVLMDNIRIDYLPAKSKRN